MLSSQLHYLPLTPAFFSILIGVLVLLVVLIQLGLLHYAYTRIGVSSRTALLLLFGSLTGSYVNNAAYYVDRILKGAKPADLPVEFPTRLELVINIGVAKSLNVEIPPTLLARADEVIE